MPTYRVDWDTLPWNTPAPAVRFKACEEHGRKLRLVEFQHGFQEADWCRKGHIGYVLAGEGDLQFTDQTVRLQAGNGIFIPAGEAHQHRLCVLSACFTCVLVEDAAP